MNQRERILAVYRGATPDVVPFMLDLSHWFYHRHRLPWDLSRSYEQPEYDLIKYHQQAGVGFYLPNLAAFYTVEYGSEVRSQVSKTMSGNSPEISWHLTTSHGSIERRRVWDEGTYSWPISAWGVRTENDLRVLGAALGNRAYRPCWDRYREWVQAVGETGVVYLPAGYSAMGQLLNYWMGIEQVMYAVYDWPVLIHEIVDRINANNLELIDLLTESPAEVIMMGDNFSSDIQSQAFFDEWSRSYYVEAIRRLHQAGKYVAVHIDGRLKNALRMISDCGADCADAVTPAPMGDLAPAECRAEAGADFILSGGVPPNLWLPNVADAVFKRAVLDWLELRKKSARLIANAGDQVPPGAVEGRIEMMRDLVETCGRF